MRDSLKVLFSYLICTCIRLIAKLGDPIATKLYYGNLYPLNGPIAVFVFTRFERTISFHDIDRITSRLSIDRIENILDACHDFSA